MTSSLDRFQQVFVHALQGEVGGAPTWTKAPGFSVYRNTVMKGAIDALEANYPSVARLVGSDWFRSAAALYVVANPPSDPRLMLYGSEFPHFLQTFEPASSLPYLPSVAHLDRAWTESHVAANAATADGAWLAGLSAFDLGATHLRPHPATRWAWFPDQPIFSIWASNRVDPSYAVPDEWAWQGQGALLTRPDQVVLWAPVGCGTCAFLDACAAGHTLSEAARQATETEEGLDLPVLIAHLLCSGALRR